MELKKVVIFGVFDGIHEGHRRFIKQAIKQGEKLVVIVARDKTVQKLKNKIPINNEIDRLNTISNLEEIDLAFLGDGEQGVYSILKEINPDIIYLGYDQKDLHSDLKEKIESGFLPQIELIFGEAYQPELFHSSILNKNKQP
jgi:FAD synthetase